MLYLAPKQKKISKGSLVILPSSPLPRWLRAMAGFIETADYGAAHLSGAAS